jgi:hypothetical protein
METNMKLIGFSNRKFNGRTIDSKGIDLDYDGNYLDVNAFNNNKLYHTTLGNDDIIDLLNTPSSKIPLEQRIMQLQYPISRPRQNRRQIQYITNFDNINIDREMKSDIEDIGMDTIMNRITRDDRDDRDVLDVDNYSPMKIYEITSNPYKSKTKKTKNKFKLNKIKSRRMGHRPKQITQKKKSHPLRLTYARVKTLTPLSRTLSRTRKTGTETGSRSKRLIEEYNSIPSIKKTIY